MEVGDWITLAAVLVALGIGVTSILHTQRLQKRERRERLLNEIIEWAINLNQATYGQDISVALLKKTEELEAAMSYGFISLKSRGKYIQRIASIFDKDLSVTVDDAMKTLESCVKAHITWMNCPDETKDKRMKQAVKEGVKVSDMAYKVIEEATKLKTQDFS